MSDALPAPMMSRCCGALFTLVVLVSAGCDVVYDPSQPNGNPPPAGAWTYQTVEGAVCGNGSPYGVAVNRRPGAERLVVFLNGGGACWDALSCFGLNAATHIANNVSPETVIAEAKKLDGWFFSRAQGPFDDASFVYAPYCTGDLHSGRRIATYDVFGAQRQVHHVGAENLDHLFAELAVDYSDADRVFLSGASAGGYGSLINWWRAAEAFGGTQVDVIDDSGLPVNVPWARYDEWQRAWALEMPPQCDDCADQMSALIPYYEEANHGRLAVLGFDSDATIAAYYGTDVGTIRAGMESIAQAMTGSAGIFRLAGTEHVVLASPTRATSTGETAADWTDAFVNEDPAWATVGP